MKEQDYIKEAKKRVKKVKDFLSHFYSWAITGIFLLALNLLTSPGFLWALIPILGWGIGLAMHAIDVFGFPGLGKNWEDEALKKEARRLKKRAQELDLDEPEAPPRQEQEQLDLPPLKQKEAKTLYKDDELV